MRIKLGKEHWCENVPKSVETNNDTNIMKQQMEVDRTIADTKPDIITRETDKEMCL